MICCCCCRLLRADAAAAMEIVGRKAEHGVWTAIKHNAAAIIFFLETVFNTILICLLSILSCIYYDYDDDSTKDDHDAKDKDVIINNLVIFYVCPSPVTT